MFIRLGSWNTAEQNLSFFPWAWCQKKMAVMWIWSIVRVSVHCEHTIKSVIKLSSLESSSTFFEWRIVTKNERAKHMVSVVELSQISPFTLSPSSFTQFGNVERGWDGVRDQANEEEKTCQGEQGVECEQALCDSRKVLCKQEGSKCWLLFLSASSIPLHALWCTFEERLTLTERGWQSHRALTGLISMAL